MVHKYDKIRRLEKDEGATFAPDELVIVQEKIDGANFRVWKEDGVLRFGSRTVEFLPETDPNCGYGTFTKAVEYVKKFNSEIHEGYIYIFEAMIKHTLNYDFDKIPSAILIDIYDINKNEYVPINVYSATAIYSTFPKAPHVFSGAYKDWDGVIPQSTFGPFQAEGVVIKPHVFSRDSFGNRHIAKKVSAEFLEENKSVFGSPADSPEDSFVSKFVTLARINKHVQKLEDAKNDKMTPEWIPIVSYNILKDICDEEFKTLLKIGNPNLRSIRAGVERELKLYLTQRGVL